jgi:hypothetical protein
LPAGRTNGQTTAPTTKVFGHYIRAFESDSMPAAECTPRVAELTARRDEFDAHSQAGSSELGIGVHRAFDLESG